MPAKWLPVHQEIKGLLAKNDELMLYGGAGSGKTHFILNTIFKRALLMDGSRHICFRKRFEHVKNTLWNSAKEHLEMEWPSLLASCETNRSGGTWSIRINDSEVLFSGLDDKERIEKHLGSEFATIYLNEVSEIAEEKDVELIASRLRQKISGRHLLLMDENPPSKTHWSYRRYIETEVKGRACFKINPIDVKENLPPAYIERLKNLPERLRKRFYDGEFLSDVEGALWTFDMIENTKTKQLGELGRIVVGVDPAVTNSENSDETGIIVAGVKGTGYKILEDCTLKASPTEWAKRAALAYYQHEADAIIVEVNNGGDLVGNVLKSINENIKVIQVRATRGKHIRAEPIASLYEQGLVEHAQGLELLEGQLQEWVPDSGMKSPDRMDALVWALHGLAFEKEQGKPLFFA
jgi:phage terminase large subunit-like protein